jgi:hypothetical protein
MAQALVAQLESKTPYDAPADDDLDCNVLNWVLDEIPAIEVLA